MSEGHSTYAPSAAHRWLPCPGSVTLEEKLEDRPTVYAAEGTVAHSLATSCLTNDNVKHPGADDARGFIGVTLGADGFKFTVDEDMAKHVNDFVKLARDFGKGGSLLVAQRVDFSSYVNMPDQTGELDVVAIQPKRLIVIDLKYGMGVPVLASIFNQETGSWDVNEQLQLYALGALHEFGMLDDFEDITLVIHQPRLNSVSEHHMKVEELLEFAQVARDGVAVCEVAREAYGTMPEVAWSAQFLRPGEKQCRFCKAKATCPALRNSIQEVTSTIVTVADFADLIDAPPDFLAGVMGRVELIEQYCKAIRAETERRLFNGIDVPGFKLVEGRRGNRAWSNADAAEKMFKAWRYKQDDMYDLKLISPTTAEKLLKKSPTRWEKAQKLISRADGKPSVAPVTDKRPAMALKDVSEQLRAIAGISEEEI